MLLDRGNFFVFSAHFGRNGLVRLSALATLCMIVFSQPSDASEQFCPAIQDDADAMKAWKMVEEDWQKFAVHRATKLRFLLDMDGPSDEQFLGWDQPGRYNGDVGVLHYYSGATGTHVSAVITRYAVVNLKEQRLIDILEASVELSGSRYTENDDGTYVEHPIQECQLTTLTWFDDHLVYGTNGRSYRLDLFADSNLNRPPPLDR